ncbi:amidohydrolase family protein [Dehalococcoidia bacterium]|nr:amidohydrolase family protein [Dehalococcoidia bacterium]
MTLDFHSHIFPPWLRQQRDRWLARDATFKALYSNPTAKMATAEELVAAMDRDSVHMAVVMGIGWTDHGLARDVNDYIIHSVSRYPDRLVGFAGVNPADGDGAAEEADRCTRAGLIGVGELHPDTQRFDLGDPATTAPLFEAAQDHGLVITTHCSEPVGHTYPGKGSTTPDVVLRFIENARRFPDVKIVCGHWGGGLPFYALMPEIAETLENVYFDTAASPFLYGPEVYQVVARLIGVEKILLGSDYPLIDHSKALAYLAESGLTKLQQQMILTNGPALLGL